MSLTLTRRHNVDRFGYLIPHRYGNLPMVGAVATYRPGEGRFGGAVAVEEGTENRIATPTTFTGWANLSGGAVLDNDGSFYPSQAKFARVTTTNWLFESNLIPATNGQTWSVSYIARRGTGDGQPRAAIMIMNESGRHVSNIYPTFSSRNIGGGWVRYEATFTINREDTGYIRLRFYVTATNGGYHDFALPQLEQKSFATSFVDGTRVAGRLVYPTSVFNPAQGTISMWVRKHQLLDYNARVFWTDSGSYRFGIHDLPSGGLTWAYVTLADGQTDGGYLTPGTWHHLVMAWHRDEGWMRGYLDGEPVASLTFDPGTDPGFVYSNTWGLGARVYGTVEFNGLFDELLILPYAASEEEIASWYEAQGPLPPHPQALLQWDWQAVRPAQMVKL